MDKDKVEGKQVEGVGGDGKEVRRWWQEIQ